MRKTKKSNLLDKMPFTDRTINSPEMLLINTQQIISAAQQMPLDELERLIEDILAARAKRVAPHLSGDETKLLRVIQKTLPKKDALRMEELQTLRDEEKLSSEGFGELAAIIEKLERLHARRMNAVLRLANLRGVTFQTTLKQVGLNLPDHK